MSSFKESGYTFDCAGLRILHVRQNSASYLQLICLQHVARSRAKQPRDLINDAWVFLQCHLLERAFQLQTEQQSEHTPHCRMLFSIVHRLLSSWDRLLLLSNNSACVANTRIVTFVGREDWHALWEVEFISQCMAACEMAGCSSADANSRRHVCRWLTQQTKINK